MIRHNLQVRFENAKGWLNLNGTLRQELIQTNGKSEIKLTFIKHNEVENQSLTGEDIMELTIGLYERLINQ